MALNAKVGCLQSTKRISKSSAAAGTELWRDEYACSLMKFERPETGVSRVEVACPTCGRPLAFRVESANRVQMRFLVMALVAAALVLGLGWFFFSNFPTHKVGRPLGLALLGAGGVGLALTLFLGLTNPALFDIAKEALSVSHAGERPPELLMGTEGAGHNLIEVWKPRAEREAAVTTPAGGA